MGYVWTIIRSTTFKDVHSRPIEVVGNIAPDKTQVTNEYIIKSYDDKSNENTIHYKEYNDALLEGCNWFHIMEMAIRKYPINTITTRKQHE